MPDPDIFQLFGLGRLTPPGGPIFPLRMTMASDLYERRIIVRRRPYLEGPAPCDDTGPENATYEISALFAERDQGIPGVAEAIYPQYHARFLREARKPGTATLYFPGRGERRVRLRRIGSSQTPAERNCEIVTISLIEDGEDNRAGADTFALPSAKSSGPVLVRQFVAATAQLGLGGDLLAQLEAAMGSLEATVNAPFTAAAQVQQRVQRVLDVCGRLRRLHTSAVQRFAPPSFSPLLPPGAAEPLALLAQIESAAAAQRAALYGTGTVRARRFTRSLSIFEIALLVGQPADDLIRMNGGLPLFGIPPGVEVLTRAA